MRFFEKMYLHSGDKGIKKANVFTTKHKGLIYDVTIKEKSC